MQVMEYYSRKTSSYSAIFATLLIVLIIIVISYNAVQKIYTDQKETQEKKEEVQKKKKKLIEKMPEGVVLYENLTDEEADRIIKELLESGEENFKKAEDLEAVITNT